MLLPLVFALALGSPTPAADRRGGLEAVVMAGLALAAAGLFVFGAAPTADGVRGGVGAHRPGAVGAAGAPLRYILLREADDDRGASQGLLTVFTSVGQLVGGALVGAVSASSAGGFPQALTVLAVVMAVLVVPSLGLKGRAAGGRGARGGRLRQNGACAAPAGATPHRERIGFPMYVFLLDLHNLLRWVIVSSASSPSPRRCAAPSRRRWTGQQNAGAPVHHLRRPAAAHRPAAVLRVQPHHHRRLRHFGAAMKNDHPLLPGRAPAADDRRHRAGAHRRGARAQADRARPRRSSTPSPWC